MVSILGANSVSGGYEVSNSLRFNDGDSAYLSKTPSSEGNRKTSTFSGWFKRGSVTESGILFEARIDNDNRFDFRFNGTKVLIYGEISNTEVVYLDTSQVFRDPAAWYHLVFVVDTTQGTQSNRVKLYVNGSQVTSFSTSTNNLSSNQDTPINTTNAHSVGANTSGGGPYDGYMTEVHFIDGTAKSPTDFGEFDDNGVWIPKKYTGTYGTNGFYLEFKQTGTSANSSGIGADTSGNDNHFTPSNLASTDVTEDTCTNNFATLNALNYQTSSALSEGNTKIVGVNADQFLSSSSIGVDEGKWYVEAKLIALSGGQAQFGITSDASEQNRNNRWVGQDSYSYGLASNDGLYNNASTVTYSNATYTTNDIISIALDLDNNLIYFYKNGTVMNSGTGYSITDPASTTNGFYFFAVSDGNSDYNATWEMNFGNAPFSISSGNNDGKYGNFEYAPPSGYYALCTKRLAEFG